MAFTYLKYSISIVWCLLSENKKHDFRIPRVHIYVCLQTKKAKISLFYLNIEMFNSLLLLTLSEKNQIFLLNFGGLTMQSHSVEKQKSSSSGLYPMAFILNNLSVLNSIYPFPCTIVLSLICISCLLLRKREISP